MDGKVHGQNHGQRQINLKVIYLTPAIPQTRLAERVEAGHISLSSTPDRSRNQKLVLTDERLQIHFCIT
jgi:hypothetical protein